MPYFRNEELIDIYADAKIGEYQFVASSIIHYHDWAGQWRGRADSDVVLQVKCDTTEYVKNGDARAKDGSDRPAFGR